MKSSLKKKMVPSTIICFISQKLRKRYYLHPCIRCFYLELQTLFDQCNRNKCQIRAIFSLNTFKGIEYLIFINKKQTTKMSLKWMDILPAWKAKNPFSVSSIWWGVWICIWSITIVIRNMLWWDYNINKKSWYLE